MMIRSRYIKGLLLMAVLFFVESGFVLISVDSKPNPKYTHYQILPKSILEVSGKTNINAFCCTSSEKFSIKKLEYVFEYDRSSISFQNIEIGFLVKQFNCGGKAINRDLYQTLQADQYPEITLVPKSVLPLNQSDLRNIGDWAEFESTTEITIACNTQTMSIPFLVNKTGKNRFRFMGSITLELCDFGIDPPSALMGLIKVKESIDINFDLFVELY